MSSDQFENDEVSMVDVLAEDKELEAEANAVFGDSDDQHCTYEKGYVKRQALYACLTCTPAAPDSDLAGVCLACSLSCHDGHDLVELYTKRNFQCDCGNEKFADFECKLQKNKDAANTLNNYNQNFKGLYCSCHRPYPDPDDETRMTNRKLARNPASTYTNCISHEPRSIEKGKGKRRIVPPGIKLIYTSIFSRCLDHKDLRE
ncbi:E3 ubiquitin- ligase UBR7, partial [Paramuricea clavata]